MARRRRRTQPEKPWVERVEDHDGSAQEHAEEGCRLNEEIAEKRMELYRLEQERKRHLARSGELAREGRRLRSAWESGPGNESADKFRDPDEGPPDLEARRRGRERYGREHEEVVRRGIEASGDPDAPDMEAGRRRWEEERYGAQADNPPPRVEPHHLHEPSRDPRGNDVAFAGEEDDGGRREEGSGAGSSSSRRRVGPTRGRPGGNRRERDDDRGMEP